eukprot:scaffold13002_cov125-Isochrysis_galbana.AAC.19
MSMEDIGTCGASPPVDCLYNPYRCNSVAVGSATLVLRNAAAAASKSDEGGTPCIRVCAPRGIGSDVQRGRRCDVNSFRLAATRRQPLKEADAWSAMFRDTSKLIHMKKIYYYLLEM